MSAAARRRRRRAPAAPRASQAVHVRDVMLRVLRQYRIKQTHNLLLLRWFTPTPNV
jgi:hypothetical protein